MIFTLEAMQAHKGDSLLLHYGDPADPQLIVIDGGPNKTWEGLRARLDAILDHAKQNESRTLTEDGKLPIRLVMVSHIDDDHIHGILEMTDALLDERRGESPPEYSIAAFWHNSFDDVIGRATAASTASVASVQGVGEADLPDHLPVEHQAKLVLQSAKQGRELRNNIERLQLSGNLPFNGLVTVDHKENPVDMDAGLTLTIVGPAQKEIDELEEDWDRHLNKARSKPGAKTQEAIAAAYLDESAYNLSSIVAVAELDGKCMLLTGDARGDHVLKGLEARGYLKPGGTMKVDVLKLPHHGSIRNVDRDFFERIQADHYVFSADGEHDNPDLETLQLVTEVLGDREYTMYLTNRVKWAVEFFDKDQPNRKYKVVYREEGQPSVRVDLGDPLPF